jgi:hypothetical protein
LLRLTALFSATCESNNAVLIDGASEIMQFAWIRMNTSSERGREAVTVVRIWRLLGSTMLAHARPAQQGRLP